VTRYSTFAAAVASVMAVQVHAQVSVGTKVRPERDYLDWITQLETAPHTSLPPSSADSARSKRYRLAVLTSEIYSTVLIEEVRFGDAGCCACVAVVRELDLDQMARAFSMRGEITGVRIVRPLSPTSFRITMHGRTFDLDDIDRPTVRVTEVR
jgi:hypothetical protein